MTLDLRLRTAIAILLAVLLVVTTGAVAVTDGSTGDRSAVMESVELEDGTDLWPYTSRSTSVQDRTLAINFVVYGDVRVTELMLRSEELGGFEEIDEEQQDIAPAEETDSNVSTIAWGGADGATRYVYVDPPDQEGQWLSESYQLSDGDYLGSRHHVRAYNDPDDGEWAAMQAHAEHWDWFHLRHTVHSIEESQLYLEETIIDRIVVDSISRERFGNDESADADGWVTVVELLGNNAGILVGAALLGAVVRRFDHRPWLQNEGVQSGLRSVLVVGAIVALYAAVRFGAIGVERLLPGMNPKAIVAVGYPVLVCGIPIVAYLLSRQLDSFHAFAAGALGIAIAMFFDYTYLGVYTLPIDTFVHRGALAVAIGFVAAGASRTARDPGLELGHVRTGVLLWLVAVAVPLLQFV